MAQPMIDTLQVADVLQRSGMEREQAEGLARSLGSELGEHIAGQKDLELGFAGMRTHVDAQWADMRAHVDAQWADMRAHVDERLAGMRAHVDERLAGMRAHVDERFVAVDKQFAQMDKQFAELKSEIKGEIKALHGKFNTLGVVLAAGIAYLGVIVSLDRFV